MKRVAATLFFLAIGTHGAAAQPEAVLERGAGAGTCTTFALAFSKNPSGAEVQFFGWAQGFMSGMNDVLAVTKNSYRDLGGDTEGHFAKIRIYCDAHPLKDFTAAIIDLWQSLPLQDYKAPPSD